MAATIKAQDKFAFLFSAITDMRSISDLEKMYITLVEYYNYLPDNIWVVQGTTPYTGSFPDLPAANQVTISNDTELRSAYDIFAQYVQTNDVNLSAGEHNTAVVYITGAGSYVSGESKLHVNDAGDYVDYSWVKNMLQTPWDPAGGGFTPAYLMKSHLAVIMQQPNCGGFLTSMQDADTIDQKTFLAACGANETSEGDATGGYFTDALCAGLRQSETLPGTHPTYPNKFADELIGAGTEDFLVSLEEAKSFAAEKNTAANYTHNNWGEPYKYLGKPEFYIRDGNPQWWESPDIYLKHPNHPAAPVGDMYIPDSAGSTAPFNNTICVDMRNVGTHPIRAYSLGIELFKTGMGATNEQLTIPDRKPALPVLKPIKVADIGTVKDNPDSYEWNTPFYEGLRHECVKAEGKLIAANVDYVWSIKANDFEAQRNTDEMAVVPSPPPPPTPAPDNNEPEPDAENDFRGENENYYAIRNPFKDDKKFILAFPREYIRYKNMISIKWFQIPEKLNSDLIPLEVQNDKFYYIPLEIKAQEKKELIFQLRMHPRFSLKKPIRLPFEILVEGDFNQPRVNINPFNPIDPRKYAPVSGITVIVKKGYSTLKGLVLDKENKPIEDASVYLRTFNGRKVATVKTDKAGRYILKEISPNNYFLRAEFGDTSSEEKVTFLTDGKVQDEILVLERNEPIAYRKIKVILDKVKILNDHDYGKNQGEIILNTVVTPDNNFRERKRVRLPEKGFYKISDKPRENEIELNMTIFEGKVKNNHLSISLGARDFDYNINPDDPFKRYFRVFTGDPSTWVGEYVPSDEIRDKERMSDWQVWYRIIAD